MEVTGSLKWQYVFLKALQIEYVKCKWLDNIFYCHLLKGVGNWKIINGIYMILDLRKMQKERSTQEVGCSIVYVYRAPNSKHSQPFIFINYTWWTNKHSSNFILFLHFRERRRENSQIKMLTWTHKKQVILHEL